ncbi:MAG: hypothetical protein WD232_08990 [Acidimicrobiales bacterium]
MSRLEEVGDADDWRCWLCDEAVDPELSVNDDRGPSIDTRETKAKAKASKKRGGGPRQERLAHRACNTGKGATEPVVVWPDHLFVVDPAPIIPTVERLGRKGGREAVARCPSLDDAQTAGAWLVDRISRLEPGLDVTTEIEPGGGQHLLILRA